MKRRKKRLNMRERPLRYCRTVLIIKHTILLTCEPYTTLETEMSHTTRVTGIDWYPMVSPSVPAKVCAVLALGRGTTIHD